MLQDGITSIETHAFYECSGLTSITIPDTVTEIGAYAFDGCSGLTEIHYTGTRKQWRNVSTHLFWANKCPLSVIHCTDGDITRIDKILQ